MNQSVLWNVVPGCFSTVAHQGGFPQSCLRLDQPPKGCQLGSRHVGTQVGIASHSGLISIPIPRPGHRESLGWLGSGDVDRLTVEGTTLGVKYSKTYGRNTLRQPQQGQGQQHIHRYTYIYIVVRTRRWQSSTCLLQLLGPGWRQD